MQIAFTKCSVHMHKPISRHWSQFDLTYSSHTTSTLSPFLYKWTRSLLVRQFSNRFSTISNFFLQRNHPHHNAADRWNFDQGLIVRRYFWRLSARGVKRVKFNPEQEATVFALIVSCFTLLSLLCETEIQWTKYGLPLLSYSHLASSIESGLGALNTNTFNHQQRLANADFNDINRPNVDTYVPFSNRIQLILTESSASTLGPW